MTEAITIDEVRALLEALGGGGMGSAGVSRADTIDDPCWNVRLIGLWSSLDRAEARARMASAAPRIASLALSQAEDFESCEYDLARLVIAVLDGCDDEALRLAKEAESNGRPGWLRKALQGNGPTKDRRTTEGRERDEARAERDVIATEHAACGDLAGHLETCVRMRDEGRAVIAAAVAALAGRSTGDLAADVAGLVELAGRDQSAEIADLRDSLDRLRARVEACSVGCRRPIRDATAPGYVCTYACGACPECLLRAEVSRVE